MADRPRPPLTIDLFDRADSEFEEMLHQRIREFNNVHSPHHRQARTGGVTPGGAMFWMRRELLKTSTP